jgi:Uma2 family endonuclease
MTALRQPALIAIEDYLGGELVSEIKHEYLGGEIHAMAGATNRHNEVATNVTTALAASLRGRRCRAFNSDTKIRIELPRQTRFYYPDAMVVCEQNDDTEQWQDRPVVVVEVLSDSTRRADLSEKRDAYLAIPSLMVLICIEPDQPAAIVHRRGATGDFLREDYAGLDSVVPLPEIGIDLVLAEVYERIEF